MLVKCGTMRRITHDDIRRGLDWVVRNRKRYGIRIVNVSCGGDYEASYLKDALSQAAERATREGILVCAAAGNAGHAPGHPVLPPASAPSVLTVGGLDDQNRLAFAGYGMYHSSYGPTVDGLQKPEVIAPGIWVAAPILPGTPTADQAAAAEPRWTTATDDGAASDVIGRPARRRHRPRRGARGRRAVPAPAGGAQDPQAHNVISGAYKHVDGTSFAAPIVSSVAALMLEANPALQPLRGEAPAHRHRSPHRRRSTPIGRAGARWTPREPSRRRRRQRRREHGGGRDGEAPQRASEKTKGRPWAPLFTTLGMIPSLGGKDAQRDSV